MKGNRVQILVVCIVILLGVTACEYVNSYASQESRIISERNNLKRSVSNLKGQIWRENRSKSYHEAISAMRSKTKTLTGQLAKLEDLLKWLRQDNDNLRTVSSIRTDLERGIERSQQQQRDIVDQERIFDRKVKEFPFISLKLSRRTCLLEMRTIRNNLVEQIPIQIGWIQELKETRESAIMRVSWSNKGLGNAATSVIESKIMELESNLGKIQAIFDKFKNFDFTSYERSVR